MATLQKIGTVGAMIALFGIASAAHAQVNTGTSVQLNASATVTPGASSKGTGILQRSSTSTGAGTATPNANTNAQMNANVNSRINVATTTGTSTATTSYVTGGNSALTGGATTTFSITRKDLQGSTTEMMDPQDVSSQDDFSAYAKSVMTADENIVKIEAGSDAVSVWYREPAKFLGVVPMMVTTKATVTANGAVSIDHPWWYKLFVRDENSEELSDSLNATAGTIARSETDATLSSSAQARLVNALRSELRVYHEANLSEGTSTDATSY